MKTAFRDSEFYRRGSQRVCERVGWGRGIRSLATVLCLAVAVAASGQGLQLVSARNPASEPPSAGAGDSFVHAMTPDGRFILFSSAAPNLATTISNQALPLYRPKPLNVFVRDRANATTVLVSVDTAGAGGANRDALPMAISTNGQFVLFESGADNLVPGDTNGFSDVFLRDLTQGTTTVVSVNTNGLPANADSIDAAMSADGTRIVFTSFAEDVVAGDDNGLADVFVRDMRTGVTTWVSEGASSDDPFAYSATPNLSADGRFVAFASTASRLVPGVPPSPDASLSDIYVKDLATGTMVWASVEARSVFAANFGVTNASSFDPLVSKDGSLVAFLVSGPDADTGLVMRYSVADGVTDVVATNAYPFAGEWDATPDGTTIAFVERPTGPAEPRVIQVWSASTQQSRVATVGVDGEPPNGWCRFPVLSADGNRLTYLSDATNLVTNPLPDGAHVYVRDLSASVTLVVDGAGQGAGAAGGAPLSADGRFVGFESLDTTLVPGDSNQGYDCFVSDLHQGSVELISRAHPDLPPATANRGSYWFLDPTSADGRLWVFSSEASDLVPGDENRRRDVFLRDRVAGTNMLLSVNAQNLPANGSSSSPSITEDGRYVVFTSLASDLFANDTNRWTDVFVRDLRKGETALLSLSHDGLSPGNFASELVGISPERNQALFTSRSSNLSTNPFFGSVPRLFLANFADRSLFQLDTGNQTPQQWALSRGGRYILVAAGVLFRPTVLSVYESGNPRAAYEQAIPGSGSALGISPDGRWLVYSTNNPSAGEWRMIDRSSGADGSLFRGIPASRYGAQFSTDSRYFVHATRLSETGHSQVYLYDFDSGTNFLISKSFQTAEAANGDSDEPTISENGRFIAFSSSATDLVPVRSRGFRNVFLYDRAANALQLVSARAGAERAPDGSSRQPIFSANGQYLLFESSAWDLVDGDFNDTNDLFAYTLPATGSDLQFSVAVSLTELGGVQLTWPTLPGRAYQLQFKNALNDSAWQEAAGVLMDAGRAHYIEPAFVPTRYYRVLSY